jgi:hypothetical protein
VYFKAALVAASFISAQAWDVAHWHFRDMPNDPENICQLGKTGSERRAVKVTRLTHIGTRTRGGQPAFFDFDQIGKSAF